MLIRKEDLALDHYSWGEFNPDNRQDIQPTRKSFDRQNGSHILWVLNWCAQENTTFQKTDIAKLETLISDKLPLEMLSEKSVCSWLVNAWHK